MSNNNIKYKLNIRDYSIFIIICTLIFSIISIIIHFLNSNLLWSVLGLSYFLSIQCYLKNANIVHRYLFYIFSNSFISKSILLINSFLLFYSSSYAIFYIIDLFDLSSNRTIYVPVNIILFLIFSSSIGLHLPHKLTRTK